LAVFRILSSLVGIGYFWAYLRHIDFTWSPYPFAARSVAACLCGGLMVVLSCRLLGLGGRWWDKLLSVAHFLAAAWVLCHTFPYVTVNEELYLMLAFWCCFVRLNSVWALPRRSVSGPRAGAPPAAVPDWPLVLLGVNVGIYFLTAGVDKWTDPLWEEGTGLYHVLLLPWIRGPGAGYLLGCRRLLLAFNYTAMVLEVAVLPLVLFRRTRWLACLCLAAFFGGLVWPLRMDWIGPVGLCIPLAIAASSPTVTRLLARAGLRWNEGAAAGQPRGGRWLSYAMGGAVALCSAWAVLETPMGTGTAESVRIRVRGPFARFYPDWLNWLNMHSTFISRKVLFTRPHTVGMWAFRVEAQLAGRPPTEPIQVFRPDKSGGNDTRGPGAPRYYQACMYPIASLSWTVSRQGTYSAYDFYVVASLLRHAADLAARQGQPVKVRLLVSPLVVPRGYEGDVSPWVGYPWTVLMEYDARTGLFRLIQRPPPCEPFSAPGT
jgi:hypothetical protein